MNLIKQVSLYTVESFILTIFGSGDFTFEKKPVSFVATQITNRAVVLKRYKMY